MRQTQLDGLDVQILQMIARDARIPFLEVARTCNVSGAAIHQRIQKLTALGIIKGSQYVLDAEKIGYDTCAYMGLNLKDPESFDQVLERLKEIPEVGTGLPSIFRNENSTTISLSETLNLVSK